MKLDCERYHMRARHMSHDKNMWLNHYFIPYPLSYSKYHLRQLLSYQGQLETTLREFIIANLPPKRKN